MTLSALKVEKAICPQDKKKLMLSDGDGLFLRVRQNGSKHWFFQVHVRRQGARAVLGRIP